MAAALIDLKNMKAYLLRNNLPLPPRNLSPSEFEHWAREFGYNEPNVGDDPEFQDVVHSDNNDFITWLNVAIALVIGAGICWLLIHLIS